MVRVRVRSTLFRNECPGQDLNPLGLGLGSGTCHCLLGLGLGVGLAQTHMEKASKVLVNPYKSEGELGLGLELGSVKVGVGGEVRGGVRVRIRARGGLLPNLTLHIIYHCSEHM